MLNEINKSHLGQVIRLMNSLRMIIGSENCILLSVNSWTMWSTSRMRSCRLVRLMLEVLTILFILIIGGNNVIRFP